MTAYLVAACASVPPRAGLPRFVTSEEIGPSAVRLDATSRARLEAAGVDPDVVYGTERDACRAEVDEQLHWFCIAPTDEEEERIARGETATFLVGP